MSVSVTEESILKGPEVQWGHIDGPLMTWAGHLHWLTLWERLKLSLGLTDIESIAESRMPRLASARRHLKACNIMIDYLNEIDKQARRLFDHWNKGGRAA